MRSRIILTTILILALIAGIIIPVLNSCNDSTEDPENGNVNTEPPPAVMAYSLINTYPHDTSAYTQGLAFYKGELYEGTGEYDGQSRLRKVDLKTGKSIREITLDSIYFGEGIAILNDTIYQLTYKEKVVFVYTLKDFKKVKQFHINTEGWGLTTDGTHLIATDGSSNLYFYDPRSFALVKTITVTESGRPSYNINELEYVNGYIYANQYESPYILRIDPQSGKVVAKSDINPIWQNIKKKYPVNVPNGIAYDSVTKKMYITGKWWPELYEVQFSN